MKCSLERICLFRAVALLDAARGLFSRSRFGRLIHADAAQPILTIFGRLRARAVYEKAVQDCPAYRDFDTREGGAGIPAVTTKANYIQKYAVAERCYNGRIPVGAVIDESSGSSGTPNQWVRGPGDRGDAHHALQNSYRTVFGRVGGVGRERERILLNCFALGPWATGMSVSAALADVAILKSVGPESDKLENALRCFGPDYDYVVFGYPPFLKDFLDRTTIDLSNYRLDLVVGGEGMTERVRERLLCRCRSVLSSYGASDLDINVALETPLSVALRKRCATDAALCRSLFDRDYPPMIFQYNPLDYGIETLPSGELAFTVARLDSAAPKIRYNLHDLGGTFSAWELTRRLAARGIPAEELTAVPHSALPFLYVWGCGDMTVPFYGAKVFPSDMDEIIAGDAQLAAGIHSFQIAAREDEEGNRRLCIALESARGATFAAEQDELRDLFFDALCRVNQDFRAVSPLFGRGSVEVRVYPFGEGPFAGGDMRIKNRYVGSLPAAVPLTTAPVHAHDLL